MKSIHYYNQIKNSPVFFGMSEDELKAILECFNARLKNYDDGDVIIRQGDMITNIYLVLEGAVNIEKDSYWGRRIIVTQLGVNDNIALAFVALFCPPVGIIDTSVLWFTAQLMVFVASIIGVKLVLPDVFKSRKDKS